MKPKKKAKELIGTFRMEIGQSDFHIPKFISGVKCANGSKKYEKVLDAETFLLAKMCAERCVEEILKTDPLSPSKWNKKLGYADASKNCEVQSYEFWQKVKQELNKL